MSWCTQSWSTEPPPAAVIGRSRASATQPPPVAGEDHGGTDPELEQEHDREPDRRGAEVGEAGVAERAAGDAVQEGHSDGGDGHGRRSDTGLGRGRREARYPPQGAPGDEGPDEQ